MLLYRVRTFWICVCFRLQSVEKDKAKLSSLRLEKERTISLPVSQWLINKKGHRINMTVQDEYGNNHILIFQLLFLQLKKLLGQRAKMWRWRTQEITKVLLTHHTLWLNESLNCVTYEASSLDSQVDTVIEVKGSTTTVTVSFEEKNEEQQDDDAEKTRSTSDQMTDGRNMHMSLLHYMQGFSSTELC